MFVSDMSLSLKYFDMHTIYCFIKRTRRRHCYSQLLCKLFNKEDIATLNSYVICLTKTLLLTTPM